MNFDRPFVDMFPEEPAPASRPRRLAAWRHPEDRGPLAEGGRELARQVSARFNLSPEEMLGPSQRKPIARARAAFYAELRKLGWSLREIAALVGRDHKAVDWALRHYEAA